MRPCRKSRASDLRRSWLRYRAVDREFVGSGLVDTPMHLDALTEDICIRGIRVPLRFGFNHEFANSTGIIAFAVAVRLGLEEVPRHWCGADVASSLSRAIDAFRRSCCHPARFHSGLVGRSLIGMRGKWSDAKQNLIAHVAEQLAVRDIETVMRNARPERLAGLRRCRRRLAALLDLAALRQMPLVSTGFGFLGCFGLRISRPPLFFPDIVAPAILIEGPVGLLPRS